jgi:hypothetical protein
VRAILALATVLCVASIFAVWANRQLLDTGYWTRTNTKLLENRAIKGGRRRRSRASAFDDDDAGRRSARAARGAPRKRCADGRGVCRGQAQASA